MNFSCVKHGTYFAYSGPFSLSNVAVATPGNGFVGLDHRGSQHKEEDWGESVRVLCLIYLFAEEKICAYIELSLSSC
jgi:hypothetical protein